MTTLYSNIFSKNHFINLLFLIIPISYLTGNLIINLNILLLIISAILFYGKDIFKIKLDILDKLILFFFSYTLFTGFLNNLIDYNSEDSLKNFTVIIKTVLYFRFLFLYFILRYLIEKKIINLKYFFFSSFFCTLFLCLDLIYQLNFGVDIFGYQAGSRRLSGPFGDELIAGSYLQRFSILSFFLIPMLPKFKGKIKQVVIISSLIALVIFSMIIAGNRMPIILFFFMITLIIFFEKKLRKFFIPFVFLIVSAFFIIIKISPVMYNHYGHFYTKVLQFQYFLYPEKNHLLTTNTHVKEFMTGYKTWVAKKYIGGGIKSWRFNCPKNAKNCSSHPHNYYLEISTELGIIGFLILSVIFSLVIYKAFLKKYFTRTVHNNFILTPFMFLFLVEVFPIKSSGSFFSTSNSTYLFLMMSITIALSMKKNLN